MKKFISMLMILALVGCASTKTVEGITYDTYGMFNIDEKKNPDIQYEVSGWSVFWGVVLFETVIAPIYFFGYDLYEPVGKKPSIKGEVVNH